ncbi:Transcriptional regulator PadR-like family protein [Atopostipes suicloacalis DSM 15692]|uniref:Transcriptional regulator PadR-like family protein n=2 Tax=Atopostipes suicloacalis TaxID=180295 RepID=A0A1M4ZNA3_9LACT|nr:Transcriptional regulator PadR-like family protein [Atopostipes suicloacalis DSM 15692]
MIYISSRYILYLDVSKDDIAKVDISEMRKIMSKPLTQPMYYILLSLREERHGYEIMQYVEWLTNGHVKIGPGTLYSLLSRFEENKYIHMVSQDNNKKTYLLTEIGKEVLNNEIKRLEHLLNDAKRSVDDEFQNRN